MMLISIKNSILIGIVVITAVSHQDLTVSLRIVCIEFYIGRTGVQTGQLFTVHQWSTQLV